MKNCKRVMLLFLVFVTCFSTFTFSNENVVLSANIEITSGSGLRIIEFKNQKMLIGFPENKTLKELFQKLSSSKNIYATKGDLTFSENDIVSTGTVLTSSGTRLSVVIKGDFSCDGFVNATDLINIKRLFIDNLQVDDVRFVSADVSEDGVIDATDYVQIRRYFLNGFDLYKEVENSVYSLPDLEIIQNSQSDYKIVYSDESEKTAAFTLKEILLEETGVTLPIEKKDASSTVENAIYLESVSESQVGNYGYSMKSSGGDFYIYASSLSGFDKAFSIIAEKLINGKDFMVSPDYSATENLVWGSNYALNGEDYNPDYNGDMFFNDKNDSVAYVSNAMWHMFGLVDDGQKAVQFLGNEPTWFEWNTEKLVWSGNTQGISDVKTKIRNSPQVTTGYMWSWGTSPFWKVDDAYSIHYDGTFRYISAVYDIISWEGKTDFLYLKDTNTASGSYSSLDTSKGLTVLQKTEKCMNYILEYLHGNEGYILLTEESTYLNSTGSKRFDYVTETGSYCWNNTGKDGSAASNYWDNLCFGNYDGYSSALLFNSLNSMAGIYRMLGGSYIEKAENLEALSLVVKEKFNEMYWSNEKGRYVACIDTDGNLVDYGLTFHNFEILKYGLADDEKAKSIFDWVDGDRTVFGDTRTGKDIFSYSKLMEAVGSDIARETALLNLRLAAASNTIAINNSENQKRNVAWWHAPLGINVWEAASYGKHLENGGYIFYPVFYELMARTEYENAQSTTDRLEQISKVYEYNKLLSDAAAVGSTNWLEGLNGEYPENGLVPTTYLYSLVGVSAEYDGLHIAPAFNDVYENMGVNKIKYGGKYYRVQVNRDASCVITPSSSTVSLKLKYSPERFKSVDYSVTVFKTDGTSKVINITPDEIGVLNISISESNVSKIEINPVLR